MSCLQLHPLQCPRATDQQTCRAWAALGGAGRRWAALRAPPTYRAVPCGITATGACAGCHVHAGQPRAASWLQLSCGATAVPVQILGRGPPWAETAPKQPQQVAGRAQQLAPCRQ
jgi:hypothetical protein